MPNLPLRPTRVLVTSAFLVVCAACGGGGGDGGQTGGITNPPPITPTTPTATSAVTMQGTAFNPQAIVVPPSAVVTFTNNDGFDHTVVFDAGGVATITAFSSGSRSATMPATPGTYSYHCSLHGGMTGSVQVQ